MKNFFISYNGADKQWAEWIAWQLEDAGYTTVLQAWDFQAGSNFVIEMHQAASDAERTIALLSNNYLQSRFTQPEWAAAFAQDPTGVNGKLLPIRIGECDLDGLLIPIIYIDLVGKAPEEARNSLLDGVKQVRAKPVRSPGFPDNAKAPVDKPKQFPGITSIPVANSLADWKIIQRLGVLGLYLLSLAAFFWGIIKLPIPLENLLGRSMPGLALAIAATPVLATIGFDAFPKLLRYWRKRKLIDNGIRGKLIEPAYFRIQPYDESDQDQKRYTRADKAHEEVLEWVKDTDEKVLYLTGRSGSGKTSLLNAFVIPALRESTPKFFPMTIRSFQDPMQVLHKTLLKPGLIWEQPPFSVTDTQQLLEIACDHIRPKRLLLIFDQFEEILIIHDRVPARIQKLEELLSSIIETNIRGLSILSVIRSDYLGKLQDLKLPIMVQGQNWREISPFTEKASRDFIKNSGLEVEDKIMNELIGHAAQIEETRGLIRPVTLNMLGMIIDRLTFTKTTGHRTRQGIGSLLIEYLLTIINASEVKGYSRQILRKMITPASTKQPRSVTDLSRETKINANAITGCLLVLSTYGLVRRIDERDNVWEISHDFVARLLGHILSSWRKTFAQRISSWVAPTSLVLWVTVIVLLMSTYFTRREQQVRVSILQRQGSIESVTGGIGVSFPSDDKDLGAVLESLKDLSNLQQLDLSETHVVDEELKYVSALTSIKVLNLNDTQITGAGLAFLANLDNLQELYLSNTRVDNDGLKHLRNLHGLRRLSLDSDPLGDPGLEHLSGLTNLQSLSLTKTRVESEGLRHLMGFSDLQQLYLGDTNLNDTGLRYLAALYSLRKLTLESSHITDAGLTALKEMKNLQELRLTDNSITSQGLENIRELKELRILRINNTSIGDQALAHLNGLKNLKELNISYTQVTGAGLQNLKGMKSLREIWAKHTKITDNGLDNLSDLIDLEILSLPENEVSDLGLEKIKMLINLQELYLGGTKITDVGLRSLKDMRKLRLLYLPGTKISDSGLIELLGFPSLQQLRINSTKVTKKGSDALRKSMPNLTID